MTAIVDALTTTKLTIGKLIQAWRQYPGKRRALSRMRQGPTIFITGAHRTGTTWVAKMMALPGLWYIHEPFNPNKGLWPEHFSYVSDGSGELDADALMDDLLRGRHRVTIHDPWTEHWLMPLRLFPQPVNRVLIKDPIACLMSEYLTRRYDLQTLVLFRHPCGFVSSLLRLGWPCTPPIRQFLACQPLMQDWLEPYREALVSASTEEGAEAAAVIYACLCKALWGYVERNERCMTPLSFEDLCASPEERFKELFRRLGLPYDEGVRQRHHDLSLVVPPGHHGHRTHDVRRNSADMAQRWRHELKSDDIEIVRHTWESFGVPLYTDGADW